MISGLLINPQLISNVGPKQLKYTLEPYKEAQGPLRAVQKFAIILMTTQGSDSLRPWFGTKMSRLSRMNIVDRVETELFIRDQVTEGVRQFFKLQAEESVQNAQTADDLITSIELLEVDINTANQVSVVIKLTPAKYSAVIYSIPVGGN
jgi:hypothetical protein